MQSERQSSSPITLLLDHHDQEFAAKVMDMSERVTVVSPRDLEENPELWDAVQVVYGGLKPEDVHKAPALRWIQISSAGANRWIQPELQERKILLTTASGIHAHPITEHMFGMLLAVTRCLPQAWDRQKTREWGGYDYNGNVGLLEGKTLGILGVGAIGGQAARVGQAFGMRVAGLRRGGEPHPFVDEMFTPETRLEFFNRCDVVMNILPGTPATNGFMGAAEFAALPDGAIVINAGRGTTINTPALMEALNSGRLGGALLDVTDPEPLPKEHPLWTCPGVHVTPHYSGGHPGYHDRADEIFLENLRRYLAGEELKNVVDFEAGY